MRTKSIPIVVSASLLFVCTRPSNGATDDPTLGCQIRLAAEDQTQGVFLGLAVAARQDLIVGGSGSDAVYLFARGPDGWFQKQRLTHTDSLFASGFGRAVSLNGDTLLVGAPLENDYDGAAYIFVRSDSHWVLQQKITTVPPGPRGNQYDLGVSVALSGDTAVIGSGAGAAFVFQRMGNIWVLQQELTGAGDASSVQYYVAIDRNTIVLGNPSGPTQGQAYIFEKSGTVWKERQKLTENDIGGSGGYGKAVAAQGDFLVVGVPFDDHAGSLSGAAYVYARTASGWQRMQRLTASDASGVSYFGDSLALDGDTLLVGAPHALVGGVSAGAAYLFHRQQGNWVQVQKLLPQQNINLQWFGGALALAPGMAVVGTAYDNFTGPTSGSVSVFGHDRGPLSITEVRADPDVLWPPNDKFVPVTIQVNAVDDCAVAGCRIIEVTSNDPGQFRDWLITGDLTLNLRARRNRGPSERLYTVTVECTDPAGNRTPGSVDIAVSRRNP